VPVRLALLAVAALALALPAGCGDSPSEESSTSGGPTRTEEAPTPGAPVGAAAKSCEAHSTDTESLRATEIPCDRARQVMYGWQREPSCSLPPGASRGSCLTRSHRCLATRADRGIAVSCARAGQSIAFISARR
jgi:hypothetical protein